MVFYNTYRGFFYRQLFQTPPPISPSNVSLKGKTAIVTGSNSGLGYHASSQLLSLGLSHLILAVRDLRKGEAASSALLDAFRRSSTSSKASPTIEVWPLNMTDDTSILSFADRVSQTPDLNVDICILNAGVARFGYEQLPNGNELTIQTNWLGTALLAILLRPILQSQYTRRTSTTTNGNANGPASAPSPPVLTFVGSDAAQWSAFKEYKIAKKEHRSVLDVLNDKSKYNAGDRYYCSKLLLTLFFREFVARLPQNNSVIVNIVSPGFCYGSELHRSLGGVPGKIFSGMKRMIGRSSEVGARTLTHAAAVAGRQSHGKYLSEEHEAPLPDFVVSDNGKEAAPMLWKEMSEDLRGAVNVDEVTQKN